LSAAEQAKPVIDADVLVVGCGPAGAASALALARAGRDVVVTDRFTSGPPRHGETLPPDGWRILCDAGLDAGFLATRPAQSVVLRSAWGSAFVQETDYTLHPEGAWWHVDRKAFDKMVLSKAMEAGARIVTDIRRLQLTLVGDEWHAQCVAADHSFTIRAQYCVDATGRVASVSRQYGAPRYEIDRMVALIALLPGTADSNEMYTLVETCEGGWWYSVLLLDGVYVCMFMTDPDLIGRGSKARRLAWGHAIRCAPHTFTRIGGLNAPAQIQCVLAGTVVHGCSVTGRLVAVGDAGLAFDPLASQGISWAISSGLAAGAALDRALDGHAGEPEGLWHERRARMAESLRLRAGYYALERRWPHHPFWERRLPSSHLRPALAVS
jgi:flavin-dependent dehydrogenase